METAMKNGMMLVRFSFSGHYPAKFAYVNWTELKRLQEIERTYGELQAARVPQDERAFVEQVMSKATVGAPYVNITAYA